MKECTKVYPGQDGILKGTNTSLKRLSFPLQLIIYTQGLGRVSDYNAYGPGFDL